MRDTPEPAVPKVSDADRLRIIIGVLTCMLLAVLDQTIVGPAIPAINDSLGGSSYISWIVSAYFLTATATTPLYGKIADIHGRRPTLFVAVAIFVVGSVICGLSSSLPMLIFGRAVQGLGGGGLTALAQTVIADLVPPRERGKFAVYISGVWAIASIAGPVLGGFITQHLSWSVIFWLNLPLAAFAVYLTTDTLKRLPWSKRDHQLDFAGAGLVMAATVALILALALGPQRGFGWGSPFVVGLLGLAAALVPITAHHMRTAPEPLIPLGVLTNPVVQKATLSVFFAMMAFIGLTVYVPLFVELKLGGSPSQAGLMLVGYMIGTVIGAFASGRTMALIPHYKRMPLAGLAVASAALAWLSLRTEHVGFIEFEVILILTGIGSGLQFPITTVSVQNAVDPRDIGAASGILQFLRALGSAIGVAVVGAVGAANGIAMAAEHGGISAAGATFSRLAPGAFAPVFAAASLGLALAFMMLALMPELPLRGHVPSEAMKD
jgi:EmrB/QacA subfamily drug resistance transporter